MVSHEKRFFVLGLIAGVVVSAIVLLYFAPRYTSVEAGDTVVKHDKWSGRAWRLVDGSWEPVDERVMEWEEVDEALLRALNIESAAVDPDKALDELRSQYPVLEKIPREDLLERIKVVYSKQILCNLYLKNFMDLQAGGGEQVSE